MTAAVIKLIALSSPPVLLVYPDTPIIRLTAMSIGKEKPLLSARFAGTVEF
jgi:hypothetical protein